MSETRSYIPSQSSEPLSNPYDIPPWAHPDGRIFDANIVDDVTFDAFPAAEPKGPILEAEIVPGALVPVIPPNQQEAQSKENREARLARWRERAMNLAQEIVSDPDYDYIHKLRIDSRVVHRASYGVDEGVVDLSKVMLTINKWRREDAAKGIELTPAAAVASYQKIVERARNQDKPIKQQLGASRRLDMLKALTQYDSGRKTGRWPAGFAGIIDD